MGSLSTNIVRYALLSQCFSLRGLAVAQLEPVKNMCKRMFHQSTIKNSTLYIDGGIESFIPIVNGSQKGNVTLGYNSYVITVDLTKSWDAGTTGSNITENLISKTANPRTGTLPPFVEKGALFRGPSNDPNIYLYGGTTSWWNVSSPDFHAPSSQTYSLWSFNIIDTTWNQYDISANVPWRPSSGAYAEAPDLALAFYFNGELDSGSSVTTGTFGDNVKVFLEGLVVINTSTHTAINVSTNAVSGDSPRTRGGLVYLPNIGPKGILVAIGGVYKAADQYDSAETPNYVPMDTIDVFDVNSLFTKIATNNTTKAWYQQKTTGTAPKTRAQFCTVLVAAADNSSYNIYVYGGTGPTQGNYDEVWVLSIPSFTWSQVYTGNSVRFGHTCHLVGNRQMLAVGGSSTLDTGDWTCDFLTKGVSILDLSTITWGTVYNASATQYIVPSNVVTVIGGTPNGNATMLEPAGGFSQPGLAQIFGRASTKSNPKPPVETKPNHTGAIVGGVVGGVVAILLSFIGLFVLRKMRAKKRRQLEADEELQNEKGGTGVDQTLQSEANGSPLLELNSLDDHERAHMIATHEAKPHELPDYGVPHELSAWRPGEGPEA